MEEIWKDIEGFEGRYQISTKGRVKNIKRNKILKLKKTRKIYPYYSVGLYKEGKVHYKLIHCLVAKAFIPNPDNLPEVNHKDWDTSNNCVENLEWCSRFYNANYRQNEREGDPILQYSLSGTLIRKWPSIRKCARETNIHRYTIQQVCIGNRKTAGGYKWRYAD